MKRTVTVWDPEGELEKKPKRFGLVSLKLPDEGYSIVFYEDPQVRRLLRHGDEICEEFEEGKSAIISVKRGDQYLIKPDNEGVRRITPAGAAALLEDVR